MARHSKPHPAPIHLTEPLTVTLSGHMLERLNEYREAVYRLSAEGWPDNAKAHTGPDSNREHYRPRRANAADCLLNFLIDQADAQQRLPVQGEASSVIIAARVEYVNCPLCNSEQPGFVADPRGGDYECDECHSVYHVPANAPIIIN